jgi:AAA+ superfamily predicted ATPase
MSETFLATPYASAREELADYLQLVTLCLERYVARHSHRMVQSNGNLSDLYVSFGEAKALLDPAAAPGDASRELVARMGWREESVLTEAIAHQRQQIRARRRLSLAAAGETPLPLENLRARFRLDERQVELLVASAAPSLSVDLSRLYTFAWSDFARKRAPVSFMAEVCADEAGAWDALVAEFRGGGPLVAYRLVELDDVQAWGSPTPLIHRSVRVPERIVAYLQAHEEPLSSSLADTCDLLPATFAPPPASLIVAEKTLEELGIALERALVDPHARPRLLLVGAPGSGRRTVLWSALAQRGWGLMSLDLARLTQEGPSFGPRLIEICREALLRRCLLLVRADTVVADREALTQWGRLLSLYLEPYEGPLALSATRAEPRLHGVLRDLFEVGFPLTRSAQQRAFWSRTLEAAGCTAPEDAPALLTQRFSLTPGAIHRAVLEARSRAVLLSGGSTAPRLRVTDLAHAVRRRTDHALGSIAEPFSTSLTWDDVVLPDKVMETLREIQGYARHRELVYDRWGFRKKVSYGRGLSCLFSGPPGTGKTMMAAVLAESLGRELYRVDLSRIMSKWVGETEKNLGLAFDEAERGQLVLLFDEADSLFAKRTKGNSSQDRFANLEINYLLQRMEAFDGMSILTTNNEKAIDEAFKRRLKFKLTFPLPEADLRAKLWKTMIPPEATSEADIDFEFLGEHFEMSGGNIRNAVLRAAFAAAEEDGIITHDRLYLAGRAEAREMGMVVRDYEE